MVLLQLLLNFAALLNITVAIMAEAVFITAWHVLRKFLELSTVFVALYKKFTIFRPGKEHEASGFQVRAVTGNRQEDGSKDYQGYLDEAAQITQCIDSRVDFAMVHDALLIQEECVGVQVRLSWI